MNFNEYQQRAKEFAAYDDDVYPFLGLACEVGEFLDKPTKVIRGDSAESVYGSPEAGRAHQLKEAGDVLWQLAACLGELGLSLQDAAELNLKKLADRKARGVIAGSGDNR